MATYEEGKDVVDLDDLLWQMDEKKKNVNVL